MTSFPSSAPSSLRSSAPRVLGGLGLSFLLVLGACGGGAHESEVHEGSPAAQQPAQSQPDQGQAAPPAQQPPVGGDLAPRSSRGETVTAEPGMTATASSGITFDLPDNWQQQPPSNNMRMAQASLPGPDGTQPAEFTAFFFGPGGGGGTEANLQRWAGQIAADGPAKRETFDSHGLKVHWIEVFGTLQASAMMGMGPGTDQPDSGLFGAVVEGPGGPWFFKVTGPRATLESNRVAFRKMLESVRVQHSV
ncbi:MAG: hypothetical protein KDD11_08565 [Acidobacteria bacterium]|nr:hypothetical protein [Acidobacteriota bacterium]